MNNKIACSNHFKYFFLFNLPLLIFSILQISCSSTTKLSKSLDQQITDPDTFEKNFTGFALYDPEDDKMIYEYNADKYFTPASNTKLFTFYAGLKILGDSVPALKYIVKNDSLVFWGTGDPSFLNPDLMDSSTYQFLSKRNEKLFYALPVHREKFFGPGWAWDDYNDYYSVERAAFPIYGNYVTFTYNCIHKSKPKVSPPYFEKYILPNEDTLTTSDLVRREVFENSFQYKIYNDTAEYKQYVPFKYSPELFTTLLSDTLKKEVTVIDHALTLNDTIRYFYSMPADSIYKRMLQVSDNFIAEQILLLCSSVLSDSLKTEITIDYMKENFLDDLPDEPVWVDGSGLSRYNLFTPRSIVKLLLKINREADDERLFELLPAGGKSGTLKNSYNGNPPYIFAKTGTLSNNHCLSGFIITQRGKKLLFSFMNNNYTVPTSQIRKRMEKVLRNIYFSY